jgi:hypothetical protein
MMWRHHGGTLYVSINGGTEVSVASGTTSTFTGSFRIGGVTPYADMKVFELFTSFDGSEDFSAVIADMMDHIGA